MWIANYEAHIDLELFVIFHNRINDNVISNVLIPQVEVNFR